MKLPLSQYLSALSRAFVVASRAATAEAVKIAESAHTDLSVKAPIGGVDLEVEGAANLPRGIPMLGRTRVATEAFLGLDDDGELQVTLKRGLFANMPKLEVEFEFERSAPIESMEILRERALDRLRDQSKLHAIKTRIMDHQEE